MEKGSSSGKSMLEKRSSLLEKSRSKDAKKDNPEIAAIESSRPEIHVEKRTKILMQPNMKFNLYDSKNTSPLDSLGKPKNRKASSRKNDVLDQEKSEAVAKINQSVITRMAIRTDPSFSEVANSSSRAVSLGMKAKSKTVSEKKIKVNKKGVSGKEIKANKKGVSEKQISGKIALQDLQPVENIIEEVAQSANNNQNNSAEIAKTNSNVDNNDPNERNIARQKITLIPFPKPKLLDVKRFELLSKNWRNFLIGQKVELTTMTEPLDLRLFAILIGKKTGQLLSFDENNTRIIKNRIQEVLQNIGKKSLKRREEEFYFVFGRVMKSLYQQFQKNKTIFYQEYFADVIEDNPQLKVEEFYFQSKWNKNNPDVSPKNSINKFLCLVFSSPKFKKDFISYVNPDDPLKSRLWIEYEKSIEKKIKKLLVYRENEMLRTSCIKNIEEEMITYFKSFKQCKLPWSYIEIESAIKWNIEKINKAADFKVI